MNNRDKCFIYSPQIPTGEARTRGYGTTKNVYVIRCEEPTKFKTLNSLTKKCVGVWKCWYIGTGRFDYGTKRGNSFRLMQEAKNLLLMITEPEQRTTFEEF